MAARLGPQGDLRRRDGNCARAFWRLRHGRGLRLYDGPQGAAAHHEAAYRSGTHGRLEARQSTGRGYSIMSSETSTPNLILTRGLFTTLDRSRPTANAVAIKDGKFLAVGRDEDVMPLAGVETSVIDLKGRRV